MTETLQRADDPYDTSLPQPAKSSARVVVDGPGLTIELTPLGFWRGTKGLGMFSILWLGFVSVFGLFSFVLAAAVGSTLHISLFLGVTVLFGGVGIFLFRSALRLGRRRALIQVDDERLAIVEQTVGSPVTRSWPRDEVASVDIGPSGVTINDVPVLELKVRTADGKTLGLFRERANEDLVWIAALIRRTLRAPDESAAQEVPTTAPTQDTVPSLGDFEAYS